MKNFRYFILLVIPVYFQSCDLDKIKTIDLNGNITKNITVSITDADPTTVSEVFTVDASTNAEMAKHLDKIEKYTIKTIRYMIKNYTGAEGITLDGHVNFGDISVPVTNLDLKAASTAQTIFDITIDEAALTAISEDLENGNSISGELEGTVSGKPVSFVVEVTFNVDFRAGL